MKEIYLRNKIWTSVVWTIGALLLSMWLFGKYWFFGFSFGMLGFICGAMVWDYEDNTK